MSNEEKQPFAPSKIVEGDYPLIDNDPHIKRVLKYARPVDYAYGCAMTAFPMAGMYIHERFQPTGALRGGLAQFMRMPAAIGLTAGFIVFYQNSILRFYGWKENQREIDMDMKEMVDKVKKGEPLYGHSSLSPYMQGVAARNSRYSAVFLHIIPWANFVNHNQHGVDTAKYYRQAEKELEAQKTGSTE